ncbi:MAG: ABC transporter substrate-binding protein [Clostridia bacterium]|nr:ABC transporter substrate-binding protein [Clostridia bacterium]
MKKILALVLATVMLFGLTACGEKPADDAAVLKLGTIGPLTGDAALYGNAVKNGAQIAVDEINALGGLQIEINHQDDEHDAEKSVNAYNNLLDEGTQIIVGSVTSAPCAAVAAEAYEDRVFMLTPSASSTDVIKGRDNVYQMCFTDPNQGAASATYIAEKKLGTKIAVIYNNGDAYSTGIYQTFKDKAAELKLSIVATETFPSDKTTDFKTQLSAAKAAGADLLFLPIYYTPASLIMGQAKDMGYAPKIFGVDGMDGILTMEGFEQSMAEGVMLLTPFSADAEDAKDFVTKYKEAHGDVPNQFAADAYDCVYAIYKAITENEIDATNMSAEELCEKMIEIFSGDFTFDGLTGTGMTWEATGEVTKDPKGMVISETGKDDEGNAVYGYIGMD